MIIRRCVLVPQGCPEDSGDGLRLWTRRLVRSALSAATEEAEQTMLDWIPMGAAAGIVGHEKAVAVALDTLQRVLPSPRAAAVAAVVVDQ